MATTVVPQRGIQTKTVTVTRPASAEDALVMTGGLQLDGQQDSNVIETYDIATFMSLGVKIPLIDGKVKLRANSNGTLFLGFILNDKWHNAYLSNTLQGKTVGKESMKLEEGDSISKSKHAVQLVFDEVAGTTGFRLVAASAGSNIATLDAFAD